jgi:hypothetical protein
MNSKRLAICTSDFKESESPPKSNRHRDYFKNRKFDSNYKSGLKKKSTFLTKNPDLEAKFEQERDRILEILFP